MYVSAMLSTTLEKRMWNGEFNLQSLGHWIQRDEILWWTMWINTPVPYSPWNKTIKLLNLQSWYLGVTHPSHSTVGMTIHALTA